MNQTPIESIPVDSIRIANPRTRNKVMWLTIVGSIEAVGLKKPITVFKRIEPDADGKLYDLVCGQGRLEAVIKLGETNVFAIVTKAPKDDRQLMTLIENIARRPPSNRSIYFEVKKLRERGYTAPVIARKLGLQTVAISMGLRVWLSVARPNSLRLLRPVACRSRSLLRLLLEAAKAFSEP